MSFRVVVVCALVVFSVAFGSMLIYCVCCCFCVVLMRVALCVDV